MLLRRVVAAVVLGLLCVVFVAGDASANIRRKEILPDYIQWGDPDIPSPCKQFDGSRQAAADDGLGSQATVRGASDQAGPRVGRCARCASRPLSRAIVRFTGWGAGPNVWIRR